jgi:hypothetical protein
MSTVMPRSALRHRPIHTREVVPEWIIASPQKTAKPAGLVSGRKPLSSVVLIGGSMVLTLLLLWMGQGVFQWGSTLVNDLHYGYPRTTQADRVVGHEIGHTISHFTAQNIGGQVYVLEIPGGDPAGSHLLVGPRLIGPNVDLVPVTLLFQGDPRHLDLMIEVDGISERFHNTGTTYTPV